MKNLINLWANAGWTSILISILFGALTISRFNKGLELGNYLYLAIGFLVVGIIQLIIKYNKNGN
jgi:H+/Cl- antiporter ClcA